MERLKVSQVAKTLGITPTAVYKKFKTSSELIQNHVHKERGVTFIDNEGMKILKASMRKTPSGNEESSKNEPIQNLVETLQKELDRKQGIIESLIAQNEEQRKRTDTILMKLTSDISNLQKTLELKKIESSKATTGGKGLSLSKFQNHRADPREIPNPKSQEKPDSPQELTFFEWLRTTVDDFLGGNYSAMRSNTDEKPVSEY